MNLAILGRAVESLDAFAADLWPAIWRACWQGGLVVLAVWLICGAIRSMPARWRVWFWRLAVLKFIAVLLLPTLLNVPVLPPTPTVHGVPVVHAVSSTPIMPVRPVDVLPKSPAVAMHWPSLQATLLLFWAIGVIWSLARLTLAWRASRHVQRCGRAIVSGPTVEQLRQQAALFGLRRLPKLLEVDGGGSPMLIGALRPTIVMPAETLARLNDSEQAMAFGHELAHIRRRDLVWGLVASLVRSAFFFHPLVWFCQRQLQLSQEIAADALAIARQRHDPIGYGSLLVSIVGKLGSTLSARPSVSTLSLETAGPLPMLTRRLLAMARFDQTSRRVVVGSSLLLVAVLLIGLVPWRLVAANQPTRYFAKIVVTETQEDGTKRALSSPTLVLPGTGWAQLSLVCGSGILNVDISSSRDKQPIEHVIEAKLTQYPAAQALEGADKPSHIALPAPPTVFRSPDEGNRVLKRMTAKEIDEMIRRNKAYQEAVEKNAVVLKSPKLIVPDGKTGNVTMTKADGTELEIEATISPYTDAPTTVAEGGAALGAAVGELVGKDKLTLADYEAIPNPKNPDWGRRPYRMDFESYGIVVAKDAKGETRIAGVNKATGEWKWLEMPKSDEIGFEPMGNDGVTAFVQHGNPLSQLAVYNGRLNKWSAFPLKDRVIDAIPCVGDRIVCYQLPDRVVAYSAAKDAWGMLLTDATAAVGDDSVFVDTADGRREFPGEKGVWTTAKTVSSASR